MMIRGCRLRVALFEMPCAAAAPSAMPRSFTSSHSACTSTPLLAALVPVAVTPTISSWALWSASGSSSAVALALWSHCFLASTFDGERGFPSGFCGRFPSWLRVLSWHASA
eukprot:scaffold11542_cov60-Phaeocystis_antarctica.AAC.3